MSIPGSPQVSSGPPSTAASTGSPDSTSFFLPLNELDFEDDEEDQNAARGGAIAGPVSWLDEIEPVDSDMSPWNSIDHRSLTPSSSLNSSRGDAIEANCVEPIMVLNALGHYDIIQEGFEPDMRRNALGQYVIVTPDMRRNELGYYEIVTPEEPEMLRGDEEERNTAAATAEPIFVLDALDDVAAADVAPGIEEQSEPSENSEQSEASVIHVPQPQGNVCVAVGPIGVVVEATSSTSSAVASSEEGTGRHRLDDLALDLDAAAASPSSAGTGGSYSPSMLSADSRGSSEACASPTEKVDPSFIPLPEDEAENDSDSDEYSPNATSTPNITAAEIVDITVAAEKYGCSSSEESEVADAAAADSGAAAAAVAVAADVGVGEAGEDVAEPEDVAATDDVDSEATTEDPDDEEDPPISRVIRVEIVMPDGRQRIVVDVRKDLLPSEPEFATLGYVCHEITDPAEAAKYKGIRNYSQKAVQVVLRSQGWSLVGQWSNCKMYERVSSSMGPTHMVTDDDTDELVSDEDNDTDELQVLHDDGLDDDGCVFDEE